MPDDSIYDNRIEELKVTDLYCGITHDYTSTKFFFTAVVPEYLFVNTEIMRMWLTINNKASDIRWMLTQNDALSNHLQGEDHELYTWLDFVLEDNSFNSYLQDHVCEDIYVEINYVTEDALNSQGSIAKTVHVYYRDDNVANNKCTVPLPNDGWQIGEYTFKCVYPETRNYTESTCTEKLAYGSWNWETEIWCENTIEDEFGNDTDMIEIYPSNNAGLIFSIIQVKNQKPVKTGEVNITIEGGTENTIISSTDLMLDYDEVEGISEDETMVYTVTNSRRTPVESGEVTIDNEAQTATTIGNIYSTSEWVSSPTLATSDDIYVKPSCTTTAIFFGRYCYSYWEKYNLVSSTSITAEVIIQDGEEYAFGLMNHSTQASMCKIHVDSDGVGQLTVNTTTSDFDVPDDLASFTFTYSRGLVNLKMNSASGGETTTLLATVGDDVGYNVYFQTYEDLDSIGCTSITGIFGGDV